MYVIHHMSPERFTSCFYFTSLKPKEAKIMILNRYECQIITNLGQDLITHSFLNHTSNSLVCSMCLENNNLLMFRKYLFSMLRSVRAQKKIQQLVHLFLYDTTKVKSVQVTLLENIREQKFPPNPNFSSFFLQFRYQFLGSWKKYLLLLPDYLPVTLCPYQYPQNHQDVSHSWSKLQHRACSKQLALSSHVLLPFFFLHCLPLPPLPPLLPSLSHFLL